MVGIYSKNLATTMKAAVTRMAISAMNLSHCYLSSLRVGRKLRDEADNEMGRRPVTPADSFVFFNAFSLERLYPLNLEEGTRSQPSSGAWFGNLAGGFDRWLILPQDPEAARLGELQRLRSGHD